MNLEIKDSGSIFEQDVEAIVNPVNCVGVMGRGLAFQFRKRYPAAFNWYRQLCDNHRLIMGIPKLYPVSGEGRLKHIVMFPTKQHWRNPSKLEDIESSLGGLGYEIIRLGIKSIALPAVGCGLGGLAWRDVLPLIEYIATETPQCHWIVFEPQEKG